MLCFEYADFKGIGCENEVEIPYSLLNILGWSQKRRDCSKITISVTTIHEIVDKEKKCKENEEEAKNWEQGGYIKTE